MTDNYILNVIIGFFLILIGIWLVDYYEKLEKKGGLTFKLRTAGLGCLIIGVSIIFREFYLQIEWMFT